MLLFYNRGLYLVFLILRQSELWLWFPWSQTIDIIQELKQVFSTKICKLGLNLIVFCSFTQRMVFLQKQIPRIKLSWWNLNETHSAFFLSVCDCMENWRTTPIFRQKWRMNYNHTFFKFVDYVLRYHISEWANNSKVWFIDLFSELSPVQLDFLLITFWFNWGWVGD